MLLMMMSRCEEDMLPRPVSFLFCTSGKESHSQACSAREEDDDYGDEDYCHNEDTDADDVDAQVWGGQAVGEEAEEAGEGGEGGRHQGEEQETVVKKNGRQKT